MLRHIVMWTLCEEAMGNSAGKNACLIKEKLEGLYGKIPEILSIRVE
ncbi:Dabb family protein [Methanolapillus ohkumae]